MNMIELRQRHADLHHVQMTSNAVMYRHVCVF